MSNQVDMRRRDCAISVLGGPTTVVDIAGRRIVLAIPAHVDGWAHFSAGADEFVAALHEAGIGSVLRVAADGHWIDLTDPTAG